MRILFGEMILLYILLSVYILAVNFYAFLLIKGRKKASDARRAGEQPSDEGVSLSASSDPSAAPAREEGDGKILLTAVLGGAITLYISMFIFRYRLNNLLLMIALPVLAALNIYLFVIAYRSGFGFFVV